MKLKTLERQNGTLSLKDRQIVAKVEQGTRFMQHPAHEARAHDLWRRGLLARESQIYSQRGTRTEYRWAYSITPEGWRAYGR